MGSEAKCRSRLIHEANTRGGFVWRLQGCPLVSECFCCQPCSGGRGHVTIIRSEIRAWICGQSACVKVVRAHPPLAATLTLTTTPLGEVRSLSWGRLCSRVYQCCWGYSLYSWGQWNWHRLSVRTSIKTWYVLFEWGVQSGDVSGGFKGGGCQKSLRVLPCQWDDEKNNWDKFQTISLPLFSSHN